MNRVISLVALAGLAVALVVTLVRPASWFTSEWPERRVEAVRAATRDPDTRVWATDRTADWLLWRLPDLRGRLAFDSRWELLDAAALDDVVAYGTRAPGWERVVAGYDVVVVDDREHLRGLIARGLGPSYRDAAIVVLERPG